MSLDTTRFAVHDVSRFPLVYFREQAVTPGYASQWETETTALVENGRPFVLIYDQLRQEETTEDRRQRGVWLKHNKIPLATVCKAMISIEPDEQQRAEARARGEMAVKAFGIAHLAVASEQEAVRQALPLVCLT
ncbi:hypothetical protein [Pseudomonas eucalypticola]|uniref:Uncharacterized protein n=1 Tax=Pseudomonas eucalypticola TaxID=2599595 RepID=A0A7D5HE23_9PSED|nr:hypothetical protein [Pseudomonas eucalypticola]QKZ05150.1 hypothetical protein HWQ56_15670 [Pseudomonas eucalypticola]